MKISKVKENSSMEARMLAREMAFQYLKKFTPDLKLEGLEITKDANGRPAITNNNLDLSLSISHTDKFIAVDISDKGEVGIDIETIREFEKEFLEKFLTESESQWLKDLDKEKFCIYATLFWSLKEAYLKALGTGIRKHPLKVEIVPTNIDKFEIRSELLHAECEVWYNIDTGNNLVITKVVITREQSSKSIENSV